MFNKRLLIFLAAAFSLTQIKIVGYIGISEVVMLACGPFLYIREWQNLKRDGFVPAITFITLWILSAMITDWYRGTLWQSALKGWASPIMVFVMIPCFYVLMKEDLRVFKWAIVGFCATVYLSTYVIQSGTSIGSAEKHGITALESALEYKLNVVDQVASVLRLIPAIFFFQVPILSTITMLGIAIFGLIMGGRSEFLVGVISTGILIIGNGGLRKVQKFGKNFITIAIIGLVLLFIAKEGYKFAVTTGWMGEDELKKYETQAASRIGLLSGRSSVVGAAFAIRDSPILGHGSWAIDYKGYAVRAMEWVGDDEGLTRYYNSADGGLGWIPGHSYILTAYVWHGILAALFWLYVLKLVINTFRKNLVTCPFLFGYFAVGLPSLVWALVFSPFGARVATTFCIVVMVLVERERKLKASHALYAQQIRGERFY